MDTHDVAADARDPPQVLVITADTWLINEVGRLSVAAGVSVWTVPEPLLAAHIWSTANMVVLDVIAARQVISLGLPSRTRIVVVAAEPVDQAADQLAAQIGAYRLVTLPQGESWLISAMAQASGSEHVRGFVLTIVGARGGAGASTLAVAVAGTAVGMGLASYLVDLDPAGCGSATVLGLDPFDGLGWHDLQGAVGRVPTGALRGGLPVVDGLRVLTWTRQEAVVPSPGVAGTVLDAAARDGDIVVVDLGRWLCAAGQQDQTLALEALSRSDRIVMVASADLRSAMAAQRLRAVGALRGFPVELVVRGPIASSLDGLDLAQALDIPLLHSMPAERGLDADLDAGEPPASRRRSPLRRASRQILKQLIQTPVA